MSRQKYTTEKIIVKLRKIEVLCSQGKTIIETYCKYSGETLGRSANRGDVKQK